MRILGVVLAILGIISTVFTYSCLVVSSRCSDQEQDEDLPCP